MGAHKDNNLDWLKSIETFLSESKTLKNSPKLYAAFDADGTLWPGDLGENFFKWQIKHCQELGLPANPWQHYRSLKSQPDPRPGYLWLAQINEGLPLEKIQNWAKSAFNEYSEGKTFPFQLSLIQLLQRYHVEIFIVTASVKWAVEPGVFQLNLKNENVIGVETEILNGKISKIQKGTITYKEGKPEELLKRTHGIKPFLVSGNSTGDLALLECATQFRVTVQSAGPDHELFENESGLKKIAKEKNWISVSVNQ